MSWEVIASDERVPATFKYIQEELNGDEKANFILPNTPQFRDIVATSDLNITIKFGGSTLFQGVLGKVGYDDANLDCIVYNKVYDKMDKKVHTGDYFGAVGNYVLNQIVDEVAGVGSGICPTSKVSVSYDHTSCLEAAKFLAKTLNSDYWTTGGSSFNIGIRGSNQGRLSDLLISRRTISPFRRRDKVLVRGIDAGGNLIYGSAGNGTNIITFTERKAMDQPTLNRIASYYKNLLNKDTQGVKLKTNIINAYTFSPGDTITINKPKLNMSGSYTIRKITKKPTVAEIEIDREETTLQNYFDKMRGYEDYGIYIYNPTQLAPTIKSTTIQSGVASGNAQNPTYINDNLITSYVVFDTSEYIHIELQKPYAMNRFRYVSGTGSIGDGRWKIQWLDIKKNQWNDWKTNISTGNWWWWTSWIYPSVGAIIAQHLKIVCTKEDSRDSPFASKTTIAELHLGYK